MTLGTIEIIFPSCWYLFWKTDSDQTNWNGITTSRSYIPASKSISGDDAEQIIYDIFTATVLLQTYSPCYMDLLPSSWIFNFSVLWVILHYWPAQIIIYCARFCHLWLLPTVIFSFPGGYTENRANLGRSSSEIVSVRIIHIYSYFLWSACNPFLIH